MAQPYIGEIRLFAGNYAPTGWLFCEGQVLAISDNDTLFTLIGTTYGGDGEQTFNLPDFRGRVPVHRGTSLGFTYNVGQSGGVAQVALSVGQLPSHTHSALGVTTSGGTTPAGHVLAANDTLVPPPYGTDTPPASLTSLAPTLIGAAGGSQPHDNMQPYLALHFIISLFGIYPTAT